MMSESPNDSGESPTVSYSQKYNSYSPPSRASYGESPDSQGESPAPYVTKSYAPVRDIKEVKEIKAVDSVKKDLPKKNSRYKI